MFDHKQVIIIRRDLKMRRGKEISQGCHSSMKVLLDIAIKHTIMPPSSVVGLGYLLSKEYLCIPLDSRTKPWLEGLFTKIVVSVDSEAELLAIHQKAKEAGLLTALIQDVGLTEFGGVPTFTAVAVGPDENSKIDAITSNLKLL